MKKLLILLFMLGVASSASASIDWLTSATSSDWFTAANWSGGVPSSTIITNVRTYQTHMNTTYMPIILSGQNADAYQLEIGGDNDVWIDDASKAKGTITLNSGGTITTADYFRVGASSSSNRWGQFYMDGGTVNVGTYMAVSQGNSTTNTHGFVYMSDGTINVAGNLIFCNGSTASGMAYISGGTINVGGLLSMRPSGTVVPGTGDAPTTLLDITGYGKVNLAGDQVATVVGYRDDGWIQTGGAEFPDEWIIYDGSTTTLIPEPATLCLLGIGALSLLRRRK